MQGKSGAWSFSKGNGKSLDTTAGRDSITLIVTWRTGWPEQEYRQLTVTLQHHARAWLFRNTGYRIHHMDKVGHYGSMLAEGEEPGILKARGSWLLPLNNEVH